MKKLRQLALALALGLVAILGTACSKDEQDASIKIGINQFMEHPALDDAREGFIASLKELGLEAEINYMNAQGDIPNSISIAQKFKKDGMDLIYAIGTPAAQASKQVSQDLPVLFSAVTDPLAAGLVKDMTRPEGNMSGTSDMADIAQQLELFKELDPSIKTIGIIYNSSEANSLAQVKIAEQELERLGLSLELSGIGSINDISQALDSLIRKVDAFYVLSDNLVASSVGLFSQKLLEADMISISAEESQVSGGILLTSGISYYKLGQETGQMARDILLDKKDISTIPIGLSQDKNIKVNKNTLEKLNIDKDKRIFKDAIFIE